MNSKFPYLFFQEP